MRAAAAHQKESARVSCGVIRLRRPHVPAHRQRDCGHEHGTRDRSRPDEVMSLLDAIYYLISIR